MAFLLAFPLGPGLFPYSVAILRAEVDMLDELQTWWQNTTPETRAALQELSLALVALAAGHFFGAMTARALRARNFDAALRLPRSAPPSPETAHGITPTLLAGLLERLTVSAA